MAQQKGVKRAEKVLKRKRKLISRAKEANLRKLELQSAQPEQEKQK